MDANPPVRRIESALHSLACGSGTLAGRVMDAHESIWMLKPSEFPRDVSPIIVALLDAIDVQAGSTISEKVHALAEEGCRQYAESVIALYTRLVERRARQA